MDKRDRELRLEAQRHAVALASSVAHEVNNPLAFMSLAASELRRMTSPIDLGRLAELSRELEASTAKIGRIIRELRVFTRASESANGRGSLVDVRQLIDGAVMLSQGHLGPRARLEIDADATAAGIDLPASCGYALLNLLLSIGEAIGLANADAGGASAPLVVPVVRIDARQERAQAVVTVRLTGEGLGGDPAEASTLACDLAEDVVNDLGGTLVTARSSSEQTYILSIPTLVHVASAGTMSSVSTASSVRAAPETDPGSRARVLVVDDEAGLARALARRLSGGYDVDVAFSAADALSLLRSTRYDAVVCDLQLPERTGVAIHREVFAVSPNQARRFIFTTGAQVEDDGIQDQAAKTGCVILEKPFDGQRLETEVARVASLS